MKVCKVCSVNQEDKEFLPSGTTKDGKSKECISCKAKKKGMEYWDYVYWYVTSHQGSTGDAKKAEAAKEWKRKHPEQTRLHSRRNYKKYPEIYKALAIKRKEASAGIDTKWTLQMEQSIKRLFCCCVLCGTSENLQIDHVRPLSKGFGLEPGNAVVLCKYCNQSKGTKELEDLPEESANKIRDAAMLFKNYWEANS